MNTVETQLTRLGLSENESALYLALLTQGSSSVRKLAGITGINRGTTYDGLKALKSRGLVSFYHEDTKQHFVAEDPSKLSSLLEAQKTELNQLTETVSELIPELKSLYDKKGGKPTVRYYEGPDGVQTILLDVLETMEEAEDSEYFVYSSASVRDAGLYSSFPNYSEERIKRGIKVRTIALGPGGGTAGLDERKWIKAAEGTPTYILIYNGKCAFISLGIGGTLFSVIVDNQGLYETQKIVFEELWNVL